MPHEIMSHSATLLWVDDENYHIGTLVGVLELYGVRVLRARSAREAMEIFASQGAQIDLVVLDVMFPNDDAFDGVTTQGGYKTGLLLGSWMREQRRDVQIVGFSMMDDSPEVLEWFRFYRYRFFSKRASKYTLVEFLKRKFAKPGQAGDQPRVFIVHGRDHLTCLALKNYIQNELKLGSPIILHEQPSLGRTIIEKFEEEAADVDIVFVLLTPDDAIVLHDEPNENKRTARQNVIFEMGYFFAKLQRTRGRVILLHKNGVDLPTDISGIVYINITNGVESAGEAIRRELRDWL